MIVLLAFSCGVIVGGTITHLLWVFEYWDELDRKEKTKDVRQL